MNSVKPLIEISRGAPKQDGGLLGEGAVVVWNDVDEAGRALFYEWHDQEHLPERLAIPGFLRGRRFRSPNHSPEWLTLYEATSLDVLTSEAYMTRLNTPTPATTEALTYFRNTSRAVCRIGKGQGSGTGGHVLAMRFDLRQEGSAEGLKAYLCDQVLPDVIRRPNVLAVSALHSDASSFLDTAESKTRRFDVPSWIVLVQASTLEAAATARDLVDDTALASIGASLRRDAAVYSLEVCRLPSPIHSESGDLK